MALALSAAERWFPLGLLVPLPGVKLGLANIVVMFALFHFGPKTAFIIALLKCLLSSMFFGGITALALSLSGASLALLAMTVLKPGYGRWFSLTGISIGGAAAHNIGQVAMASVLIGSWSVFGYLAVLLVTGVITGIVTGTIAAPLFTRLSRAGCAPEVPMQVSQSV